MKNLIALLSVIGAGFIAAPDAEARPHCNSAHTYVSHHTSCGCPVYKQRYIAYYDRCGHPVYRTRIVPVQHRCRPAVVHPRHRVQQRHIVPSRPVVRHPGRYTSGGVRIGPVIVGGGSSGRCR